MDVPKVSLDCPLSTKEILIVSCSEVYIAPESRTLTELAFIRTERCLLLDLADNRGIVLDFVKQILSCDRY